jgi:cytochrome P450
VYVTLILAHTPFRRALERTLKPTRLKRLQTVLEARAEAEFLPLLQAGHGDICQSLMARFPAWAETEWLNLDPDVAPMLADTAAKWVNAWRVQDGESVTRYSTQLYGIAQDLLADRKANPRDPEEDPASSLLLEVDENGNHLDETHLVGALRQSLVVGMVAPPVIGGSIFKHLSEDPELQDQLRQDPSLIPAAVEEFLRLYSPCEHLV